MQRCTYAPPNIMDAVSHMRSAHSPKIASLRRPNRSRGVLHPNNKNKGCLLKYMPSAHGRSLNSQYRILFAKNSVFGFDWDLNFDFHQLFPRVCYTTRFGVWFWIVFAFRFSIDLSKFLDRKWCLALKIAPSRSLTINWSIFAVGDDPWFPSRGRTRSIVGANKTLQLV